MTVTYERSTDKPAQLLAILGGGMLGVLLSARTGPSSVLALFKSSDCRD